MGLKISEKGRELRMNSGYLDFKDTPKTDVGKRSDAQGRTHPNWGEQLGDLDKKKKSRIRRDQVPAQMGE